MMNPQAAVQFAQAHLELEKARAKMHQAEARLQAAKAQYTAALKALHGGEPEAERNGQAECLMAAN